VGTEFPMNSGIVIYEHGFLQAGAMLKRVVPKIMLSGGMSLVDFLFYLFINRDSNFSKINFQSLHYMNLRATINVAQVKN
jgi:hypothetical protein